MRQRPYHHYFFFSISPEFFHLSEAERRRLKRELADYLQSYDRTAVIAYDMLGYKGKLDVMLWCRSEDTEAAPELLRGMRRLEVGRYIRLERTLFGIIRRSQYSSQSERQEQTISELERLPYLIIYPFTKTNEWYQLPPEERRALMKDHIRMGIEHKTIRQCLLYSYGVDDHEFIVSYETPTLEEFQDLIIDMRSLKVRPYTLNDLPVYTCRYKPLEELAEWL